MPPKKESKPAGGSKQAAGGKSGGKGAKAAEAKGMLPALSFYRNLETNNQDNLCCLYH